MNKFYIMRVKAREFALNIPSNCRMVVLISRGAQIPSTMSPGWWIFCMLVSVICGSSVWCLLCYSSGA